MHNRVGLGTFLLAGVFNKISKEKAKDLVELFLSSGGFYIDTAPMYGFGEVEKLLGEALKDISRDKFYKLAPSEMFNDKFIDSRIEVKMK